MFCDLVGSTELSGRHNPEDLRELLRRYHDAMTAVVLRYGGYVANYLGDGILAYFGWPRAEEDEAAQAVRVGRGRRGEGIVVPGTYRDRFRHRRRRPEGRRASASGSDRGAEDVGEGMALLAPLLSLPASERYGAIELAAEQRKERVLRFLGDQAVLDRVVAAEEDDRDRRGCAFGRQCRNRAAGGRDHVYLAAEEIGGQRGQPIIAALRLAVLDRHVLSFDIAGLAQPLVERGHKRCKRGGQAAAEKADHRHRVLLRAEAARRRRHCAAQQQHQLATPHSIASLCSLGMII
jgi:hypothetical protein